MYLLRLAVCVSAAIISGCVVLAAENKSITVSAKELAHQEFLKLEKELETIEKLDDETWPPAMERSNVGSGSSVRKSQKEIRDLIRERQLLEQPAKVHLMSIWSSDLPDDDRLQLERQIYKLKDYHTMVFEAIAPDEFRTQSPFKLGGSSERNQFVDGKSNTLQGIDLTNPPVNYPVKSDE